MDTFKKQRQAIKSSLTRIQSICADTNTTFDDLKVRVERAEELFKQYGEIQNEIDLLTTTASELEQEDEYRSIIEEKYYTIKACYSRAQVEDGNTTVIENQQSSRDISTAMQALMEHQGTMGSLIERISQNVGSEGRSSSSPTNTTNSFQQLTQQELRLPRIQIPDFDGKCIEWMRFRDLFEAMVHNKSNISNVEKLEYLQTKVKGEALSLIKHLQPANANYEIAWQLLKKKYDKPDNIKKAYFEILFDQPVMKMSSVSEAKRMYNTTNETINALRVLKEPVEHWDSILLFILEKKLDSETHTLWYRDRKPDDSTTIQHFLNFLEKRVFELENTSKGTNNQSHQSHSKQNQSRTFTTVMQACPACSSNHPLYNCSKFKELTVEAKRKIVQQGNMCFNCLQPGHQAVNCKRSFCRKCNGKHNTLLHLERSSTDKQQTSVSQPPKRSEETTSISVNSLQSSPKSITLLPTAMVMVKDATDSLQPCRALLDSGSQGTLISAACVQRLHLKPKYDNTILYGVGSTDGSRSKGKVCISIHASQGKTIATEGLCLPNLTRNLPSYEVSSQNTEYFKHLELADPCYYKPGRIDLILGADVLADCILPSIISHPSGSPSAMHTIFGWVLIGRLESETEQHIITAHTLMEISQQLQQFWEIEDVQGPIQHLTPDELAAENHYKQFIKRDKCGKYVVKLPLKNESIQLGDSRNNALKRFLAMERRFHNNAQLKQEYQTFMNDYITLGHMGPAGNSDPKRTYFLPHHAVLKPSSTTTKLRVVFDGSCRTTNGLSLNDQLLVGPTIQRDLFDIILNFRKYKVGFTGDIEKMYRQILVDPDDQSLQCILWRSSNDEPIKEYNLKTVTYGTSAAPFLATRTLKQIANDNANAHPRAAEAISQHFYVDDFMASAIDEDTAIQLKEDICAMLSGAGLHLRKWSSNSATFLESIPSEDREYQPDTIIDNTCTVKTLGLLWDTSTDSFKYSVSLPSNQHTTKRSVLSDLARVFDPIGWLAPVVISMKIFMQKLWLRGIGWDEALPQDLYTQWVEYRESINRVLQLHIPRWIHYSNEKLVQLHGFADSSELAYAATIYSRVQHENGQVSTNLIAAKTRVAPVKQITLPRLELCGSHLMTKLMTKVQNALDLPKAETFGWTDSTIVLAWLRDHPRRWKTFVANRTAEILQVVPSERWRHIPSQENPADLATRGLRPQELLSNEIWWHGPSKLKDIPETCHLMPPLEDDILQEERKSTVALASITTEFSLIERYSCFTRLLRITSLLLRFVNNCKAKRINSKGNNQFITTSELRTAHDVLVRSAQAVSYTFELRTIGQDRQLPSSHKLAPLSPFIDKQGLLRVGGRVTNAKISYNQKHPFLLDKTHPLTKLIVRDYHMRYLHAGHRQLHYLLALKYWIPGVTHVIKQCIFKCTVCMRHRGIPYQQQMGDIPKYRLDPGTPFLNTGIDFAGPVQVRSWKGRGSKLYKCWIALFICLTTKAIHIELVTELSTAAFIASLRRFTARRGKPLHIFSDNGTNFVGANQHLRELYQYINESTTQDTISRVSAEQEIQWHFSPPSGPHFGGIWEAGVKSVKYHLKRILADASITYEELHTILCQIEGCLNSRPLCTKFEGDTDPLTPAHFLILRPMTSLPEKNLLNLKENAVNRWQYLQKLTQHFWKRWSMEYITQLQQRPKWSQRLKNLEVNDVVIIKDDNLAPTQWSIGKISEVHPGSDGLVRVVSVDTARGTLKRPIVKLCPLFIDI